MRCIILAGGEIRDYDFFSSYLKEEDFIICADSGLRHAHALGKQPDIILGDFDSVDPALQEDYSQVECLSFPPEKDQTDTEIAIDVACEKGASEVILMGATGGRLDHTMGNVHCLVKLLDRNIKGSIVDEYNSLILIKDKAVFHKNKGSYVSLIPFAGDVKGITTKGLKYPLENAVIKVGTTLGISNECIDSIGEVRIKEGILIGVQSRDL